MTKFYNEPKNKLPRATGMEPVALNLHNFNKDSLTNIQKRAIEVAYVRHSIFFEENGYECQYWYLYDRETETLHTNDIRCPNVCHHHIGSICGVCGQKD